MTRFADQLFDDLMREHGSDLARTKVPAPRRHLATRPVLLTAGAGTVAVAAAVGTLAAGGGAPAYAVTPHSDGTVTVAIYQKSGIAQANAELRRISHGRVVVVPIEPGCPSIHSLRPAAVLPYATDLDLGRNRAGVPTTVDARGIPAGDVEVVAYAPLGKNGGFYAEVGVTSPPVPKCVSDPLSHPSNHG